MVGQDAVREYGGSMGAGPLPCEDPVACGSLVSDKLMMTLSHLPLTIMNRYSAILSISRTGECVLRWLQMPPWPEVEKASWGELRGSLSLWIT